MRIAEAVHKLCTAFAIRIARSISELKQEQVQENSSCNM